MKRIQMYIGDVAGCAHYRMMLPAFGLNKTGKYECNVSMIINDQKESWNPDVTVLSRQYKEAVKNYVKKWKDEGRRLVYDVDDNLIQIYPSNPAYKVYQEVKPTFLATMRLCDVLTVSTKPLFEVYSKVHPNVKILPNCIIPSYAKLRTNNLSKNIRIGWAGSNTHYTDFREAEDALIKIGEEYDNVTLVFFGYIPDSVRVRFSDQYGNPISGKLEYHPFIPISKYHVKLGLLSLDIGLAPLHNNEFNRGKSNLKILEYGVMGIPTIASAVYPYATTIQDGKDGRLVYKKKHWYRTLKEVIENEEARQLMGVEAQKKVLEQYNIETNVNLWEEAYFG